MHTYTVLSKSIEFIKINYTRLLFDFYTYTFVYDSILPDILYLLKNHFILRTHI